MRKALLGDLSSLVKTAKKLQDTLQANGDLTPVFEQLDELVLKAFKLVTRAVRFLDIWAQDTVSAPLDFEDAGNNRPLTPPSDAAHPLVQPASQSSSQAHGDEYACPVPQDVATSAPQPGAESGMPQPPRSLNRISVAFSLPSESESLQSPLFPPQPHTQAKRLSVTHRLSYTGKSQGLRKQHLASERLNAAHDAFLGFIGSFIGLHLQSRCSEELTLTTQQSVVACQQLLVVVDEVWERDSHRSEQLAETRETMYTRLTELVEATKHVFKSPELGDGDEVLVQDSGKELVTAATSCVRAAGDCVTKTRNVIERIGDFEFEHVGLALSDSIFDGLAQINDRPAVAKSSEPTLEVDKPLPATPGPESEPESRLPPPPLIISESKPLPDVPAPSPLENTTITLQPIQPAIAESPTAVSFRSSRSSLPPLTQLPTPNLPQPTPSESSASPASATHRFFPNASTNASVADTNSTYRNSIPCESGSFVSQASTRATTPDQSPVNKQNSQTLMSSFGSSSELRSMASEDIAAGEEHILETTYAHELIYNKDGQISGGSLPALVEQLTTHESTPDVMFLNAFWLTFRLFTSPVELAQCLIDRFDRVGDSHTVGVPVKLRVYNAFKSWLETHWQAETDNPALEIILAFANGKLRAALPSAGKRLAELTTRATDGHDGSVAPRSPSTFGNCPHPIVTRSQLNALKAVKDGKATCSILDFDPLELARQFTLIESKLFCAIQPEELLASEWTKKHGSKAVNVRALAVLSTDLANLVTDTILTLEDIKKRALVIKQWVKIAAKCVELHNYDSLMAIIASLNSSMVTRLKRTWELVSSKTKARLAEMTAMTDVSRNYSALRQRLQNHVGPCIPFVGYYLTDLTFVDAGNAATRELPGEPESGGKHVINFDKHMKTARIISQILAFQVQYRLTAVPEMQDWMQSQIQRMHISEDANVSSQYRRSLMLEPREAQAFKATLPQNPVDSSASSTFSADSRSNSKDRFDFLNFHFSTNTVKDR